MPAYAVAGPKGAVVMLCLLGALTALAVVLIATGAQSTSALAGAGRPS